MPICLVVQHSESEPAYAISDALEAAGCGVKVITTHTGAAVPADCTGIDAVVVMGGSMSARLDKSFSSRRSEIALLQNALDGSLPILGVCLGAQLLAAAGGGNVTIGANGPEIGWAPVFLDLQRETDDLFFELPHSFEVLHWHGETFDLPPGALRLASSHLYKNQAFRLGSSAWGLQFHLEVESDAVARFSTDMAEDLDNAIGGPTQVTARADECLALLAPIRQKVFSRFASLVVESSR